MTSYTVGWEKGIALPGQGLWLDPLTVRDVAVVTHAHSDHARRHRHAICTAPTYDLATGPRRPHGASTLGYGQGHRVGDVTVTLHDAGHMLGSAQVVVDHLGSRLLYTGDLKLRRGAERPDTVIPAADVLVLETTYGRPHFRFPDVDSVAEALARWCRRAIDSRVTPVVLAHAVGKAQEVMTALSEYGFCFALEARCVEPARAYERAGIRLPDWLPLGEDDPEPGRVVIAPPAGKERVRRLSRYRTALVSGWAQDASFWRLFGADIAFPLSDHCDFDELMLVAERCGAEQVYTVHGFTEEFARSLRRTGIRASALARSEQLALAL